MIPVHEASTTRQMTTHPPRASVRLLISLVAAGAVITLFTIAMTNRSSSGAPAAPAQAQPLVDGWSSYLGAAAPEPELVDGWSSYLLVDGSDGMPLVDGWSSYLLVDEPDPDTLVDGWMPRYGHSED